MQAPFVKEVERLGLIWAFTLKPQLCASAGSCVKDGSA
jgi:hypothetical protein